MGVAWGGGHGLGGGPDLRWWVWVEEVGGS